MNTPIIQAARLGPGDPRRRGVLAAIAGAGLALLAGCSASAAQSAAPPTPTSSHSPSPSASASSTGNVSSNNRNGAQGNAGSGTFSLAFAHCMRAHGVPSFPDPNGQAGQLGPGSGIDPNSAQFQSAINGPCLSLAPPAWVSSGKVTPP